MLGQGCYTCEDTGVIEVEVNSIKSTRYCHCNRGISRRVQGAKQTVAELHSVILNQWEKEKNLNMVTQTNSAFASTPGVRIVNWQLPGTVPHSNRGGTCMTLDSGGNDNTWHVSLVVPPGNEGLFHLGKDLKKYANDKTVQEVGQTTVKKLDLFHKILKQIDSDYPFMESSRFTAPCGCREWRMPVMELATIEKLAKQLGLSVRVGQYHKSKNCKDSLKMGLVPVSAGQTKLLLC